MFSLGSLFHPSLKVFVWSLETPNCASISVGFSFKILNRFSLCSLIIFSEVTEPIPVNRELDRYICAPLEGNSPRNNRAFLLVICFFFISETGATYHPCFRFSSGNSTRPTEMALPSFTPDLKTCINSKLQEISSKSSFSFFFFCFLDHVLKFDLEVLKQEGHECFSLPKS